MNEFMISMAQLKTLLSKWDGKAEVIDKAISTANKFIKKIFLMQ